MGWTGQRDQGWSAEEFVRTQFHQIFNKNCSLVDVAVSNKKPNFKKATAYVAYKNPDGISCCVILLARDKDGFYSKEIHETMGPAESKCPKRILKLLDEPANDYAKEWRKRCEANLKKSKKQVQQQEQGIPLSALQELQNALGNNGAVFILDPSDPKKLEQTYKDLENILGD